MASDDNYLNMAVWEFEPAGSKISKIRVSEKIYVYTIPQDLRVYYPFMIRLGCGLFLCITAVETLKLLLGKLAMMLHCSLDGAAHHEVTSHKTNLFKLYIMK